MSSRATRVIINGQTVYQWDADAGEGRTLERFSELGPVGV
jgi:hypothetical protein